MECLDSDITLVGHKVKMMVDLYSVLADTDRELLNKIEKGEADLDQETQELYLRAIEGFKRASQQVIAEAADFLRHGIPIRGMELLKKIVADPTAGLEVFQMVQLASQRVQDREIDIPEETLERVARAGQKYRSVG